MAAGSQIDNPYSPLVKRSFIESGIKAGRFKMEVCGLEKKCPQCEEFWPWDTQFFPFKRQSGTLESWCRACLNDLRATNRPGARVSAPSCIERVDSAA